MKKCYLEETIFPLRYHTLAIFEKAPMNFLANPIQTDDKKDILRKPLCCLAFSKAKLVTVWSRKIKARASRTYLRYV